MVKYMPIWRLVNQLAYAEIVPVLHFRNTWAWTAELISPQQSGSRRESVPGRIDWEHASFNGSAGADEAGASKRLACTNSDGQATAGSRERIRSDSTAGVSGSVEPSRSSYRVPSTSRTAERT